MANHHRGERGQLLELTDLALEPRIFQRPVSNHQEAVRLEWLFDEIIGAALDRRDRGLDIAVAGNHDDRQFGVFLFEGIEKLQAVEAAALQPNVEKHQIWPARDDSAQRLIAVARSTGAVAFILQDACDQFANIGFVVDYEDI